MELELYKKNALNGELLERVKNDIERQEAISEYLFEQAVNCCLFFIVMNMV